MVTDSFSNFGCTLCVNACFPLNVILFTFVSTLSFLYFICLFAFSDTGYQWAPFCMYLRGESPSGSVLRWMG